MHITRKHLHVLIGVYAVTAAGLWSGRSSASHKKEDAPINLTGHVLPWGNFELGLHTQSAGVLPHVMLSSNVTGIFLGAITGVWVPNVSLRVGTFRLLDPLFVSVGSGLIYIGTDARADAELMDLGAEFSGDRVQIPLHVAVSFQPNDEWLLSADGAYFATVTNAESTSDTTTSNGVLGGESFQVGTTLQYALNDLHAVTLKARWVPHAPAHPFEVQAALNDNSQLTLTGNASVTSLLNAYQVLPGWAFSWDSFNLRLGVGYGHFFIPSLGIVSSYEGPIGDLELYWRF